MQHLPAPQELDTLVAGLHSSGQMIPRLSSPQIRMGQDAFQSFGYSPPLGPSPPRAALGEGNRWNKPVTSGWHVLMKERGRFHFFGGGGRASQSPSNWRRPTGRSCSLWQAKLRTAYASEGSRTPHQGILPLTLQRDHFVFILRSHSVKVMDQLIRHPEKPCM